MEPERGAAYRRAISPAPAARGNNAKCDSRRLVFCHHRATRGSAPFVVVVAVSRRAERPTRRRITPRETKDASDSFIRFSLWEMTRRRGLRFVDLWVHDISPPSALVVDRRTRRALGVGDRHRRGSPPRMAGGGGGECSIPFVSRPFERPPPDPGLVGRTFLSSAHGASSLASRRPPPPSISPSNPAEWLPNHAAM